MTDFPENDNGRLIRICLTVFDDELREDEMRLFRGAVIALSDNNPLFHNHAGEGYRYSYPKIQYKMLGRNPAILGIEEGADCLQEIFTEDRTAALRIGRSMRRMRVKSQETLSIPVAITTDIHLYLLERWLPLNEQNFRQYLQADGLRERVVLLENILTGNILSFAKGIGVFFDNKVECRLEEIISTSSLLYKGVELKSFTVIFTSNVLLPPLIGIGKSASLNHGVIKKI